MDNTILLVEKSRSGDRDAFAGIVGQYQGMVSAVTLNIVGDYAQSEDLAQETFLTAWKKLPELRDPEKLSSWLYGIARNVALRWRERQNRDLLKKAGEFDDQTMSNRLVDPAEAERMLQREQSLQLVWSSVKELPEKYREPLLLYYRHSRSVADIAEAMCLSEETVCQRLSRGRKMLKTEVEKRVETVLEETRPDTAFTLAVLASLPLAATVSGCSATSKSLGIASGTFGAGMGGSAAGGPWIILAILSVFLGCLIQSSISILFTIITCYLLWLAIKKSPSSRTRRFVVSAAIDYAVLFWIYTLSKQSGMIFVAIASASKRMSDFAYIKSIPLPPEIGYVLLNFPIFLIFSVFMVYVILRWQKLLAEDQDVFPQDTKPVELDGETPLWLSSFDNELNIISKTKQTVRQWQDYFLTDTGIRKKLNYGMVIISICLGIYLVLQILFVAKVAPNANSSSPTISAWYCGMMVWSCVLQIAIQAAFFVVFARGVRIANLAATDIPLQNTTIAEAEDKFYRDRWEMLKYIAFLLLALPVMMMVLDVAVGLVRYLQFETIAVNEKTVYIYPVPGHIYPKLPAIVVLAVATALWASQNREKRFLAFSLLFLGVGLALAIFIEWAPLFSSDWMSALYQLFFWWMNETDRKGFTHDVSNWSYLCYHIFTAVWLVYTLSLSVVFYLLHRIQLRTTRASV